MASQVLATRHVLFLHNVRRLVQGESGDDVYPDAVAAAELAFDLLERGLAGYCVNLRGQT